MEDIIKKYGRIICILVFTAGFMLIGMLAGLIFIKPVYTSTASYLVTDTSGFHNEIIHPDEIREFFSHDYFAEHLSEKAGGKYSTSEMADMISVRTSRTSPTFKVRVTCSNSTDVFFIQKTIEAAPRALTPEMSDEHFLIIVIDSARFPEKPVRPGFRIISFAAAMLGAAVSLFVIKSKKDVFTNNTTESLFRFNVPVIARIPVYKKSLSQPAVSDPEFTKIFLKNSELGKEKKRTADISDYNPDGNTIMIGPSTDTEFFDAFRQLFASVEAMTEGRRSVILMTSPEIADGKTTMAINLGITAAAEGKSVLLIDCNFHNRRLMRAFNIDQDTPGICEMVYSGISARDAILFTEYHSLFVLPQGRCQSKNPLSVLTHPETLNAIRSMREMFDYVIIDAPSVNAVPDALALSESADLVFLTVRNKVTNDRETEKALKSLELSEVEAAGFILNGAQLFNDNQGFSAPDLQNISKNKFISGFGLDYRL